MHALELKLELCRAASSSSWRPPVLHSSSGANVGQERGWGLFIGVVSLNQKKGREKRRGGEPEEEDRFNVKKIAKISGPK